MKTWTFDEQIIKLCKLLNVEYGTSRIDGLPIINITDVSKFEQYKKYLHYSVIYPFEEFLTTEKQKCSTMLIKILYIDDRIFYLRKEKLERILK